MIIQFDVEELCNSTTKTTYTEINRKMVCFLRANHGVSLHNVPIKVSVENIFKLVRLYT